jgi:hypothetical protein
VIFCVLSVKSAIQRPWYCVCEERQCCCCNFALRLPWFCTCGKDDIECACPNPNPFWPSRRERRNAYLAKVGRAVLMDEWEVYVARPVSSGVGAEARNSFVLCKATRCPTRCCITLTPLALWRTTVAPVVLSSLDYLVGCENGAFVDAGCVGIGGHLDMPLWQHCRRVLYDGCWVGSVAQCVKGKGVWVQLAEDDWHNGSNGVTHKLFGPDDYIVPYVTISELQERPWLVSRCYVVYDADNDDDAPDPVYDNPRHDFTPPSSPAHSSPCASPLPLPPDLGEVFRDMF